MDSTPPDVCRSTIRDRLPGWLEGLSKSTIILLEIYELVADVQGNPVHAAVAKAFALAAASLARRADDLRKNSIKQPEPEEVSEP